MNLMGVEFHQVTKKDQKRIRCQHAECDRAAVKCCYLRGGGLSFHYVCATHFQDWIWKETRRKDVYAALAELCSKHGADDLLFCLSVLLRDRAEATGSERYEAAAEDVARAYERRAGGELDPEKGRAR